MHYIITNPKFAAKTIIYIDDDKDNDLAIKCQAECEGREMSLELYYNYFELPFENNTGMQLDFINTILKKLRLDTIHIYPHKDKPEVIIFIKNI